MATVREVAEATETLVPARLRLREAVVATKLTVVDPFTNPVPVTVRVDPFAGYAGPWVLESPVTVGVLVREIELLMVIPVPQVDTQGPGLMVGALEE